MCTDAQNQVCKQAECNQAEDKLVLGKFGHI